MTGRAYIEEVQIATLKIYRYEKSELLGKQVGKNPELLQAHKHAIKKK